MLLLKFIILSLLIAGPFLAKSTYYSGTPLFPLATGTLQLNDNIQNDTRHWKSIEASTEKFLSHVKDGYGYGRSPAAFLKHFWLIAVPDKGVNNKFDYPLGLVYLLVLGPFFVHYIKMFARKEFALLPHFVVLYWLTWWCGSHQSRFLYIPVVLMIVLVISSMSQPSLVFKGVLLVAMVLSAISVVRVQKRSFGLSPYEVLREKDRELLEINKQYAISKKQGFIELDFHDAAYAIFPVKVTKERLPHTLAVH